MKIKKYIVDSMPEAMQQIRTELGNNAMILNTKKVKTGGWFGLFSKQQIEVIAAVDQENREMSRQATSTAGKSLLKPHSAAVLNRAVEEKKRSFEVSEGVSEALRVNTQPPAPKQDDILLREMQQMKKVISSILAENTEHLPESVREIDRMLKQHELADPIRTDIVTTVLHEMEGSDAASKKDALRIARNRLHHFVQQSNKQAEIIESINQAKVICFVGPTGVGKTTTIAKLAAKLMFQQHKKVGFITSDTYRIAAVEQLKTYANIMQIPLEVVFSPEEMEQALEKLQACDVILMDTAGRNYKQKEYIAELNELISNTNGIQIQIVLSLTSKYEDMISIMEQFSEIELDGLILTKVDETSSYGAIVNLLQRFSIPLAFMTNGQNVPDDMILVQPDTIVDLLLGEWVYEGSS